MVLHGENDGDGDGDGDAGWLFRTSSSRLVSPSEEVDVTSENSFAIRAWLSVQKKLQGREGADILSVDGQVGLSPSP